MLFEYDFLRRGRLRDLYSKQNKTKQALSAEEVPTMCEGILATDALLAPLIPDPNSFSSCSDCKSSPPPGLDYFRLHTYAESTP